MKPFVLKRAGPPGSEVGGSERRTAARKSARRARAQTPVWHSWPLLVLCSEAVGDKNPEGLEAFSYNSATFSRFGFFFITKV